MSFSSSHSVVVGTSPSAAYDQLSGADNFTKMMKLAPACYSIEIQQTEDVCVKFSSEYGDAATQSLCDITLHRPSIDAISAENAAADSPGTYLGNRVHFRMVERIKVAFGAMTKDIEIIGGQTFVPSLKMHIYQTVAGGGLVKTYKLRRFVEDKANSSDEPGTRIEEYVAGETTWILRRLTESACRDAHPKHMNEYHTIIK